MTYHLGIDIGDTYVHAATARMSRPEGVVVEPFSLGDAGVAMPAVMWVASDRECIFGNAAQSRGAEQPERLIGRIRPRVGAGVPFVVGAYEFSGEEAYARLAAAVVDTVAEAEGQYPDCVILTHPASWGTHRLDLVRAELARHCAVDVDLLPEPQAVALRLEEPVKPGQLVAVFDLGGTTLNTSVLRIAGDGRHVVTVSSDVVPLGGIDFDDALVAGVRAAEPELVGSPRGSMSLLRPEASRAKEELSSEFVTTISTQDRDGSTTVRVSRHEFETMVHGLFERAVAALNETFDSSGVSVDDIATVILAGGSSRIPGVAHYIATSLGRPVAADPDPDVLIAVGAARSKLAHSDEATVQRMLADVSDDDASDSTEDASPLIHFIPPHRTQLATVVWRVALGALILVSAAYLVLVLGPELSGLLGDAWSPIVDSGNGVAGVVQ